MRFRHLPGHRPPGHQSRRDRVVFPAWIAAATLLLGGASVTFAAENLGDGAVGAGDLWAGAPIAVLAGAFLTIRQRFPRRARRLRLVVASDEVRRGEAVATRLTIDAGEPLGAERVELGLVCVERYDEKAKSTQSRWTTWPQTEQDTVCEDWREVDARLSHHELSFEVPREEPYSYEGKHLSYAWRVCAREVRARREDRFADHPIWVLP